jgi:hypothetical protein
MTTLLQLVTFCLVCYGATNILVYGKIFDKIRPDWYIAKCSMCTGFWVGVALSLVPNGLFSFSVDGTTQVMCGLLSSGVSYILCSIIDDDGIKFTKKIKAEKGVK